MTSTTAATSSVRLLARPIESAGNLQNSFLRKTIHSVITKQDAARIREYKEMQDERGTKPDSLIALVKDPDDARRIFGLQESKGQGEQIIRRQVEEISCNGGDTNGNFSQVIQRVRKVGGGDHGNASKTPKMSQVAFQQAKSQRTQKAIQSQAEVPQTNANSTPINVGSSVKSKSSRVLKSDAKIIETKSTTPGGLISNRHIYSFGQGSGVDPSSVLSMHSVSQSGMNIQKNPHIIIKLEPKERESKKRYSDRQKHQQEGETSFQLIKKSNSLKSVNAEPVPQLMSHLINSASKNHGHLKPQIEKYQSLMGDSQTQSQGSLLSQTKGQVGGNNRSSSLSNMSNLLQNSNKKQLMPGGGSSGNLFKKQILEQEEANSSSSSSIGREENVNQALNQSLGAQRMKNQLLNQSQDSGFKRFQVSKGPSTTDFGLIAHHSASLEQNAGDLDDSLIDRYTIEVPSSKQVNQIKVNQKLIKTKQETLKVDESNADDTLLLDSKFFISASHAVAQVNANQQTLKGLKTLKNNINQQSPRKSIIHSSISTNQLSSNNVSSSPNILKSKIKLDLYANAFPDKSSTSQAPSTLALKPGVSNQLGQGNIKLKVSHKALPSPASSITFVHPQAKRIIHLGTALQTTNAGLVDDIKLSFKDISRPQVSPRVTQKRGDDQVIRASEVASEPAPNGKVKVISSEGRNVKAQIQKSAKVVIKGSHIANVPNFTIKEHNIMKSKSPSEFTIDSGRVMSQQNFAETHLLHTKKMQTQDLKGISSFALLTPQRENHVQNLKQNQAISKQIKGSEINHQTTFKISSNSKPEDIDEGVFSPKTIQNQLNQSIKSQTQNISIIKGLNEAKGRMVRLLDEFQSLDIEDDVNEERDPVENLHVERRVQINSNQVFGHSSRSTFNVMSPENLKEESPQKQQKQHLSPSLSNRIPNSLAFRIHANQGVSHFDDRTADLSEVGNSNNKDTNIRQIKLFSDVNLVQSESHDEINLLSTRRLGATGEYSDFSLRNKYELNRNIPNSKGFGIDFRGMNFGSSPKRPKSLAVRCPELILDPIALRKAVTFMDFENLLKMMSLNKTLREGFTATPTALQKSFSKIFKAQLRVLLIDCLKSTTQRIQYWNFRTKFYYGKKKKPNLYRTLKRLKTNENAAAEIRKDIHRTFPDIEYFQKPLGQDKLFNVLNAIAQKNVKTGYIQGMNFLAGTILLNLQRGEETFWMMMSILNKFGFDSILDLKKGGRFQVLCYQLEILMQNQLPDLFQHLKKLKIPTDIYAANWFITMFCYELSLDLVFCILDIFLLDGIKSLLRISLALLRCMQTKLLQMDYDECMVYLSHQQKDLEIDSQTLLQIAYNYKITNSMMEDLEAYFYFQNAPLKSHQSLRESRDHLLIKSFHQITLQESKTSKGKTLYSWVVLPATPEDMQELIRQVKSKHKDQEPVSEEEILTFYQHNLYYKNIRDIVNDFGSEQKKPNFEGKTPGSPPSQHKYTRKKALSTVFNDQDQALLPLRGTVGPFPGNYNTIYELSNEEYSRGGYSSTKKPLPYPVAGSKLKLPDDVQSFTEEEESILRQQATHLDYRSHQVNKSAMGLQNSSKGALPGGAEDNPDESEPTMRLSEVIPKGGGNSLLISTDSPFQRFGNQIGTSIKNMFGGFGSLLFKKGDEEGERLGRQAEPQMTGAMRSRSIQSVHMNTKAEVMKVGPGPQQIIEKAQSRNQKKIEGQMSSQSMILQSTNKQTQSKQKTPSSKPLHLPPPKSHTSLGLTVNSRQPQHHYLKTHAATPTHQDLKQQEPQSFINFLRDSFSLLKAEPPPQSLLQNVKDFDRSSGGNEDVNLDDDEDFLYRTGDAQGTTERVSGFEKVQYRAARVESPDFMAHKRKLFAGGK